MELGYASTSWQQVVEMGTETEVVGGGRRLAGMSSLNVMILAWGIVEETMWTTGFVVAVLGNTRRFAVFMYAGGCGGLV